MGQRSSTQSSTGTGAGAGTSPTSGGPPVRRADSMGRGTSKDGEENILEAAARGNTDRVKVLVAEEPASLDAKDGSGRTPLMIAAFWGHSATVEALLKLGADPKLEDARGQTAVHWAAIGGQADTITLLVTAGGRANVDDGTVTPLHVAVGGVGASSPPQHIASPPPAAISSPAPAAVAAAGESGGSALGESEGEATPVDAHVPHGNEHLPSIVEEHDDAEAEKQPLKIKLNVKAVKALLSHGAKIGARDHDGRTALHRAAETGNGAVIEVLVDAGADVNALDREGSTALHRAASTGNVDTVQALLHARARPDIKAADGRLPIDVARANKKDEVVAVLEGGEAY